MITIFAHRGASAEAPENTLPAFQLALKQGSKALELDVHLSQDGELIVCHDAGLERTTDGTGFIRDYLYSDLKKMDAGSWFSQTFKGTTLPTLEEVLELCQKDICINIEIKNIPFFYQGIEEKVVAQVKRFGFEDNTIISSFDHQALLKVQQLNSEIKIGVLLANHLIEPWRYIASSGLRAYSIHPVHTFVNEEFMKNSHSSGMKVYAYTVDDIQTFNKLKQLGVNGLFTNKPSTFINQNQRKCR